MDSEDLFTSARELGKLLNIPPRTVQWNIQQGLLPAIRLSRGRLLIEAADLKAWRKSRERKIQARDSEPAVAHAAGGEATR